MATKAIALFMLPLYTAYLNPTQYGILNNLESISYFLPILFSFALIPAFNRFYHERNQSHDYLQRLLSTMFWFILASSLVVVGLFIGFTYFWLDDFLSITSYPYAYVAFIPSIFMELSLLGYAFFKQSLEGRTVSMILIISALINVFFSVYLLVYQDLGVLARLWGKFFATAFSFFIIVFYVYKRDLLRFTFDIALLKRCLIYSLPLVPMLASVIIYELSDRLVITKYDSLHAVGVYSSASHIGGVLNVLGISIITAIAPLAMNNLEHNKISALHKIETYSFYLWIFMLFACLFIFFFCKEVVVFFLDASYNKVYLVAPILAMARVFDVQHNLFSQIIAYHKKTWIFTTAAITTAILNVILNLLLVPLYGYMAAVWTTLFSSFFYTTCIICKSMQLESISFNFLKYGLSFGLFGILATISYLIPLSFLIKGLMFILITIAVIYFFVQNLDLRL